MTLDELAKHEADLNDRLQDRLSEKASLGIKTNLFYKSGTFQPMTGGGTSGVTINRGKSPRQLEIDEEVEQIKAALADLAEQRKQAVAEENKRIVADAKGAIDAEHRKFAPALAQVFESLKVFEDVKYKLSLRNAKFGSIFPLDINIKSDELKDLVLQCLKLGLCKKPKGI